MTFHSRACVIQIPSGVAAHLKIPSYGVFGGLQEHKDLLTHAQARQETKTT